MTSKILYHSGTADTVADVLNRKGGCTVAQLAVHEWEILNDVIDCVQLLVF